MPPVSIAIIGRPNVGKSTLFNRLVGTRLALVHGEAGVTRDRHYGEGEWLGRVFRVIDTSGLMTGPLDTLMHAMREQTERAIIEAETILFVVDARQALTSVDHDIAMQLHKARKRVVLVANKVEAMHAGVELAPLYRLGFGEPLCISAEHGQGVGDLLDVVLQELPSVQEPAETEYAIQVAIVGRPNVGKSSLINRVLGERRLLVDNVPGTTRDAIDTTVRVEQQCYTFVDTAGMRKLRHISATLEKAAVATSLKRIQRCDVAVLLLDALAGVSAQDTHIASYIEQQGKACILALNKWDAVVKTPQTYQDFVYTIQDTMPFLAHAPILSLSALTGQRVVKLFPHIDAVYAEARRHISTARLHEFLHTVTQEHPAPLYRGKFVKFSFLVQTAALPPTFCGFVNHPEGVTQFYRRYLENQLRQHFGFAGVPIRLHFKRK
jgi:GTP-binding protein